MLTPNKMEQRKIEGWVGDTAEQWLKDNALGGVIFRKTEGRNELQATLIIGGKGFTESEVKALEEENAQLKLDLQRVTADLQQAVDELQRIASDEVTAMDPTNEPYESEDLWDRLRVDDPSDNLD